MTTDSKIEERTSEIKRREDNANTALSESMQGEIKQVSIDSISTNFQCHGDALENQRHDAIKEIDINIAAVEASLNNAISLGASDFETAMRDALDKLIRSRAETLVQFDKAQEQISKAKEDALNKIIEGSA